MKKTICLIVAFLCCMSVDGLHAQSQADTAMKQAQASLQQKEYTQARSLFMHAYRGFAASAQYEKATQCGVRAAWLYYRENFYQEAFDLLRRIDQQTATYEQETHKSCPDLYYATTKERLHIYIRLKHAPRAQEQLDRLENLAKASLADSLQNDLLYTKANYYYTCGMNAQGDEAIGRLVGQYKEDRQYDKVTDCYRTLIGMARNNGNIALTARTYEQFMVWKDSIQVLKAKDDLAALQKECREKQDIIDEKDSTLQGRQYIIYGLCLLAALLAAALAGGGIVLVRFILLTRQQKKAIATAHEHNELKSGFIRNISAQMAPTLGQLDASLPAVKALKSFIAHIEELSEQESRLTEKCELQEKNIATFCEELAQQVEGQLKKDVALVIHAPKLNVAIHPEMLGHVLLHLLTNAAIYTPAGGKITLEYKKRGAHAHQFTVCDTGCGISPEQRSQLFKPFAEVKDLTQGDGLGLPICALMATRMNGSLTLDENYTKGACFILSLHS